MIAHQIIVSKPHIVATASWISEVKAKAPYNDQNSYNTWLAVQPYNLGDFITMLPVNSKVMALGQVSRITKINGDFHTLEFSNYSREYKPFFVVQCNLLNQVDPWTRWDNTTGWRHLTQEEYDKFITPSYDQLQDYCSKYYGPETE